MALMLWKFASSRSSFAMAILKFFSRNNTSCMANIELTNPAAKIWSSSAIVRPLICCARKALNFSFDCSMNLFSLSFVVIKSASALAAMQTSVHHLLEQWTWAELAVFQFVIQYLNRKQDRVQSNEVGGFQRTHLVLKAVLEDLVHHFGRSNIFLHQKNRFINGQHQHPIGNKPRRIVNQDRFFTH